MAAPMPCDPPVTRATLPASWFDMTTQTPDSGRDRPARETSSLLTWSDLLGARNGRALQLSSPTDAALSVNTWVNAAGEFR